MLAATAAAATPATTTDSSPLAARIAEVSAKYLGTPYLLDPLGEGPEGSIDRDPLIRFDRFDCETFVETVLAEARSETPDEILIELNALRYRDGRIDFAARNHFPDLDWIPNNVARGILVELTPSVAGAHPLSSARALITRRSWLARLAENPSQARNAYLRSSPAASAALQSMAAAARDEEAVLRYIPKEALGDREVLARIPSAAIVFLVWPHVRTLAVTGSLENVSHFGFAIRERGVLVLRHASSGRAHAVVDVPLAGYLATLARSRSFAGIAVFGVR